MSNTKDTNTQSTSKSNVDKSMPIWLIVIIIASSLLIALSIFWFIESQNFIKEVNAYFQVDSSNQKSLDPLFESMNDFLNTLSSEEIKAIGMGDDQITSIFFKNYTKLNRDIPKEKFDLLTKYFLARNTVQDNSVLNDANNLKLFLSEYDKTSDYFILLAQRQDRMLKILASIMSVTITIIAFLGYHNLKEIKNDMQNDFNRNSNTLDNNFKTNTKNLNEKFTTYTNTITKLVNTEVTKAVYENKLEIEKDFIDQFDEMEAINAQINQDQIYIEDRIKKIETFEETISLYEKRNNSIIYAFNQLYMLFNDLSCIIDPESNTNLTNLKGIIDSLSEDIEKIKDENNRTEEADSATSHSIKTDFIKDFKPLETEIKTTTTLPPKEINLKKKQYLVEGGDENE